MTRQRRHKVLVLCMMIVLCPFIVAISSAGISDQMKIKQDPGLPPLPPGFVGDATPNEKLKADYLRSNYLTLAENQIQLYSGWNMISVPLKLQSGYDTGMAVFGNLDTGGHTIWCHNGQTQQWEPVYANTIITPLVGYMV